jgi:DNA-binding SARP family transcriptional activator
MAPFEDHDARSSWFLPRSEVLLDEAQSDPWIAGMEVVSPGLVTLGRDPQGLLLVDVEQAGSVELLGDSSDDVLRAMVIELATSSWSEQVNVVVVGMDRSSVRHEQGPTLDVLDRVRLVGSLVEVLPELRHLTTERSVMLDAVGFDRSSDARLAVSGDGWDLTVVFCTSQALSANPKAIADLVALAAEGDRGLAAVCAGTTVEAKWRIQVGNGPTSFRLSGVPGPDTMLWPQRVDREAEGQIARLVDVARKLDGVDPSTPPYDSLETRLPPTDAQSGSGVDGDPGTELESDIEQLIDSGAGEQPPAIEILVLGTVQVIGAARPFTRAWSLELVVYLAMHPGGATSDQWATHLWPSRSMAQASLHSTASAARRALGSAATGEDHLPRSHGRLSLGPGVTSDWDQFCHLSASDDPSSWRRALELVRGRPFDGLRSTDWAVFSHVQANIESLVVDVAVRRCEHCLESGDPAGAEWAARQGLLVSPYDERLYRILMRAAYQAGNLAGVEASMTELLQLVGGEVEPYDSVHPETSALYHSLSRKNASTRQR